MSAPASISESVAKRAAKAVMLAPILAVPLARCRRCSGSIAGICRRCSDYAREAIETNGAWKGGWLTLARLCRCHPWGSHGFDPVPDLSGEHHPFAPWRYGRWRLTP